MANFPKNSILPPEAQTAANVAGKVLSAKEVYKVVKGGALFTPLSAVIAAASVAQEVIENPKPCNIANAVLKQTPVGSFQNLVGDKSSPCDDPNPEIFGKPFQFGNLGDLTPSCNHFSDHGCEERGR